MKTQDHPTDSPWLLSKTILTEGEIEGTLTVLGPGVETQAPDHPVAHDTVLFVAEGTPTVIIGELNYVLRPEEAFVVQRGKTHRFHNESPAPARVFAVSLPAPRPAEPAIVYP